jgi:hypothetical protein
MGSGALKLIGGGRASGVCVAMPGSLLVVSSGALVAAFNHFESRLRPLFSDIPLYPWQASQPDLLSSLFGSCYNRALSGLGISPARPRQTVESKSTRDSEGTKGHS